MSTTVPSRTSSPTGSEAPPHPTADAPDAPDPNGAMGALVALAAELCEAPIAVAVRVDAERVDVLAARGLEGHTTQVDAALERFLAGRADHDGAPDSLWCGGAPLIGGDGRVLGALCIFDRRPRELTDLQRRTLTALAGQIVALLTLSASEQRAAAKAERLDLALAQATDRHHHFFDRNPQPMWVYDLETLAFLAVNDAAVAHYGYSRDEFLAMHITDIRPPDDVPALLDQIRTMPSGLGPSGIWRHRIRDGRIIRAEVSSHAIDFEGRPARLVSALDATARLDAEDELRSSQASLARAQHLAHLGSWELDLASGALHWSAEIFAIFGLEPATFGATFEAFLEAVHPEDRARMQAAQDRALRGEARLDIEHRIVRPDGGERWVHELAALEYDDALRPFRLTGTVLDITDRKRTEARLARLNRLYAMLSRTNETIVRIESPQALFEAVTAIAVEQGAFRMAVVVGVDEASGKVTPLAHAGHVEGYFEEVRVSARDDDFGRGTIGTAIRTGRHDVCNDFLRDPRMAAWHEPARRRGYRATASFPIRTDAKVIGALVLFAHEPQYFQPDEVELLLAVAEDVSFALDSWRKEQQRAEAEAALSATRRQNQLILESVGEGIHGLDLDGRIVFENPAAVAMFGWTEAEMIGQPAHALVHHHRPDGRPYEPDDCPIRATMHDGLTRRVDDEVFFRRDGSSFPVEYVCTPVTDEAGAISGVVVCFRDISERVRTDRTQRFEANILESISSGRPLDEVLHAVVGGVEAMLADALASVTVADAQGRQRLAVGPLRTAPSLADPAVLVVPVGVDGDVSATLAIHHPATRAPSEDEVELARRFARVVRIAIERDQKEQELRTSEQRFRRTFLDAATGIAITALDGRFLETNAAYRRMLGYTEEELRGTDFLALTHPDERPSNAVLVHELVEGRRDSLIIEKRYLHKSGRPVWTRVSIAAVRDMDGRATGMIGVAEDVTEQHAALDALAQSQSLLRIAGKIARVGGWAMGLPDNTIFWSEEVMNILGWPPGHAPTIDEALALCPPAWRPRLVDAFKACARVGTPFDYELEVDTMGGDHGGRSGRIWARIKGEADRDAQGRIRRVHGAFSDITQRRKDEAQLRLLETCIARLNDIVMITEAEPIDEPGPRILFVNEAFEKHTGYTREEAIGRTPRMLRGARTQRDVSARIRAALQGWQPVRAELINYKKNGEEIWLELDIVPVADETGWYTHWVAIERDVTERKRTEEALRGNQALLQIASTVGKMGAWSIEVPSLVHAWSAEARAIHGVDRDFVPQLERLLSVYEQPWSDVIRDAFVRCAGDGTPFDLEARLTRPDETTIWVRVIGEAVRDEAGAIIRVQGALQDIDDRKRAESSLAASEARYRQLAESATALAQQLSRTLESITDAFFTLDRDWRFAYVNAEAERLLERARHDLLGHEMWQEFPESVGTTFEREYRRAMSESVTVQFEALYGPLGKWFEVIAYPSAEGLAVYFHDVSERRTNREALRTSEERFRLLSRATNDAIWDWDLKTNSLWWNEGYEHIFGHARQPSDDIDSWIALLHPDDRERIVKSLYGIIDTGELTWSDEYRFRHRDGHYLYVLDRGHVMRDADGTVTRMVGGVTDLTERRRTEEKLREQATLLDRAQDAILVRDLEHRIHYWNRSAERVYGWTASEVLGRSINEILYVDTTAFYVATEVVLARGEWVGELEQVTKDGRPIIIEGRWTLVRDDAGRPRSILAINTDITEKKRLEEQFLRAQRLESIGTLAGGIAHDLNNMLAPILMTVSVMRDEESDAQKIEDLDSIESCAKRGADMVRQLLSFARGTDGRRTRIHLGDIATEIRKMVRDSFPKNIVFRLDVAPDVWLVHADPTQMHQLLTNLCVNARDAMPDGGTLTLALSHVVLDEVYAGMTFDARPGPYVLVRVEDTGTGMSREVLDRIFEPFFTTKEVGKGTGLGLSTVHAIVKSHEGFVHVYSEVGRGTRFKVYLPADVPAVVRAQASLEVLGMPRGDGEVVLVIDDEESIRQVAQRTLERYGYRVLLASNGAEGIAVFVQHAHEIAVVLTDMTMPVMDGPATIIALRSIDPAVRVIASSGLDANGNVAQAVVAGVRHFVPKPYTAEAILRAIRRALTDDAL